MDDDDIKGNVAEIIAAAREQQPEITEIEHDGITVPILFVPKGGGAVEVASAKRFVDEWRTCPERREGTAKLGDLASFCGHANRFKDDDSAIFVGDDPKAPTFLAVLDYHKRANVDVAGKDGKIVTAHDDKAAPRFGRHRGTYAPQKSTEWTAWTEKGGEKPIEMSQADFAAFISSRAFNVLDVEDLPDGGIAELPAWYAKTFGGKVAREGGPGAFFASRASLLTLADGLDVAVNEAVGEVTPQMGNGNARITFGSNVTTSVEVPAAFVIAVPLWKGGDLWQIPVRLKMTVRTSGDTKRIGWRVELFGVERTFAAAMSAARAEVEKATGLPVFVGSPE